MRPIEIKERLKPYSKRPGIKVPLAEAEIICTLFPSKLSFQQEQSSLEILWKFKEIPKTFVVFLNLYKRRIEVQLGFEEGVFHYDLLIEKQQLLLIVKRAFKKMSLLNIQKNKEFLLAEKEKVVLIENCRAFEGETLELLSLGSHKKQQIEPLLEREDFKEILPLLFLLGQTVEKKQKATFVGNLIYIREVQELMKQKKHDILLTHLNLLIRFSFTGILVPHLEDVHHWRALAPEIFSLSPFILLRELSSLIRAFFILKEKNTLFFLPHLPKELFCGRLLNLQEEGLILDLEWTKKSLRLLKIKVHSEQTLKLHFQKSIQKCRLRVDNKPFTFENKSSITFEKSKTYYFDRFEA